MPYLGFVVRNCEIKVSQESRESPLPRGHQHRVTGAALADTVRVKTTKSTPHICASGKAQQTRLTQDSNSTDLVQLALRICPEPFPRLLTHCSSSALCPHLGEQRGSDCPWLSSGCSKVTLAASSALPFALLPGAAKQSVLFEPGRAQSPVPAAPQHHHPSQSWGQLGALAHLAAPPRGLQSSSLHVCPPWQLHHTRKGRL